MLRPFHVFTTPAEQGWRCSVKNSHFIAPLPRRKPLWSPLNSERAQGTHPHNSAHELSDCALFKTNKTTQTHPKQRKKSNRFYELKSYYKFWSIIWINVSLFLVCSSKTVETYVLTEQYVKELKSLCWTESDSHFSLIRKFRLFQTLVRVSPASIKTQQVIMTLKRQLEIVTSTKEMRLMLRTWFRQGGSQKCHEWESKAVYKSSLDLETAQGMSATAVCQWLDMGKCSHELRTWHFSVVVREKIRKRWKKNATP